MAWLQTGCVPVQENPKATYTIKLVVAALVVHNPELRFFMDKGNLCVLADDPEHLTFFHRLDSIFYSFKHRYIVIFVPNLSLFEKVSICINYIFDL